MPVPVLVPRATRPRSSRAALLLVVGGVTFLLSIVALLGRSALREAEKAVGSPRAPRSAPRVAPAASADQPSMWFSRFEQALVKGEGAVPNIVGVARVGGGARLVALEGESGKLLWGVPDNGASDVYANGDDVILTYNPTKTVTRRDAKTGAVRWSIEVADFVHDVTFGPGCASIRFREPLGVDTQTGALKDCKPTREALARVERNELKDLTFQQGDIVLRAGIRTDSKPINPEPARFALSAKRGKDTVWEVVPSELSPIWSSDGFSRSVALTPSGLFVFGRDPSNLQARWLLLDSRGRSSYSRSSQTKVDEAVWVTGGGPVVFVVHDGRLEAYQAETGALIWQVADAPPG